MSDSKVVDILKKAIILEQQGQSFYRAVAGQTKSEAVKNIFTIMAEEEQKHEAALTKQAERYSSGKGFDMDFDLGQQEEYSSKVLSPQIKGQIGAAGYEAASISAAIAFEQKAVDLYSQRAAESGDEAEKALFSELANWERTHLTFLNEIYTDLLEDSWYDQKFWPF